MKREWYLMEYIIDAFNALQIENKIQIITTLITGLGIIISLINKS